MTHSLTVSSSEVVKLTESFVLGSAKHGYIWNFNCILLQSVIFRAQSAVMKVISM